MTRFRLLAPLLPLLCAAPGMAQEVAHAYVGARIIPIEGSVIEKGTLVTLWGKIAAVGPAGSVEIPTKAIKIDAAGKVIMPGLICTHSHVGGIGGADSSGPIQPDVRILDSINVHNPGFRRAVAGGLTTINIMPGSGHLNSGQTIYVKLRKARTIEEMFIYGDDGRPMGGLKMANGTNSMRKKPFPGTRGKSAALVRQKLIKAQEYQKKIAKAAGDPEKMPDRDIGLDALVEVLEGKRIVHFHTHRHDDIMTILRLKKEFGFRVVLHHISEGWKVADEIAAAGVPCSVIVIDSPGGKLEARELHLDTGGILERAGILTAFHTDDWITDSRLFFRSGALAVRAGMTREGALKALTHAGAQMLDLGDRIGSLKPGKDADFIILDGDPLSVYTKVLQTYVDGFKVFDRSDPEDRLHAVGGYGAGDDEEPYMCCYDHAEDQ
ncbi:MAG: amidohydrolase family protein [Phycisphaerae bacterium]